MRKSGTAILVVLAITALSGCYGTMTLSTPSGLREHHRGKNGSLSIAKTPAGEEDYYHSTQKHYESQKTERTLGRVQEAIQEFGS